MIIAIGGMSTFGGPEDTGVTPSEGLALIEPVDLEEWWFRRLFLAEQPEDTTGLARRLNPEAFYIAMRWKDYGIDRETARRATFRIWSMETRLSVDAWGADFGPAEWTDRVTDLSPGIAAELELQTDDDVIIEML